ncbi:hypothetical protein [Thioalkalivibrio sp. ALJ20]|uniref:hypothetical protein n=1 Tax=Thioalkalivibrio sp. ALJ20 TaxID=1158763 RepID=UPI0012DEDB91|nr:hypothetical protein [Thioalkalivibrio sp. ALJ20]
MSLFAQLQEKAQSANAEGGGSMAPMENIAIAVSGYDMSGQTHYAVGRRIDDDGNPDPNSPEIRISLREDKQKRANPRAEIADFANPSSKSHTTQGGILVASNCYPTRGAENTYSSRWLRPYAHNPSEAIVLRRLTTVDAYQGVDDKNQPRQFVRLVSLRPSGAQAVTSSADLRAKLRDALQPSNPAINTLAVVRAVAAGPDGTDQTFGVVVDSHSERDPSTGYNLTADAEKSLQMLESNGTRSGFRLADFDQVLGDPNLKMMEVVPGTAIYMGKQSVQAFFKNPKTVDLTNQTYRVPSLAEDGVERAFIPTWVALREYPQRDPNVAPGLFVTEFAPEFSFPDRYRLHDIPTPNYSNPAAAFPSNPPKKEGTQHQTPMNQGQAMPQQQSPMNQGQAMPQQQSPVNQGHAMPPQQSPVNQGQAMPQQQNPMNQGQAMPQQQSPMNQGQAMPQQQNPVNQGQAMPQQQNPMNQGQAVPPPHQGFDQTPPPPMDDQADGLSEEDAAFLDQMAPSSAFRPQV